MSERISGKYNGFSMIIYKETALGIIVAGLSQIFNNLSTCWGCECGDVTLIYLFRCNRLRCPLARLSGLQGFNVYHNGHGINLVHV